MEAVTRAQLVLLARTLHVPVERLTHLERLGAAGLHELQQRMASKIFAENAATFARVSALVPVVPLSISIPLVQRIVPPMMAGRAAGAVGVRHPKKAAEAVGMLAVSYAADCAPYLDPRAVGELAEVAPPEPIVAITNELLRRGDYITAGPFLAYATPKLIRAVEQGVPDDEAIIHAAAYAYSGTNVSAIVRQLLTGTSGRIPQMLTTVLAGSAELRLAALSVFARCDGDVIADLGDILFDLADPAAISDLITTVIEGAALPDMLRYTGQLSPSALDILAANPSTGEDAVLGPIVDALRECTEPAQWRGLLNLLERTDEDLQRRIGREISGFAEPTLAALPDIVTTARLWPALLRVLAGTDSDTQVRLGEIWAKLPAEERAAIERRVHDLRLDTRLATLTVTLQIYG